MTVDAVLRGLLLTGVAGVGKSTVADAIGRALTGAGRVTAVVDTDMLAQFGPAAGRRGLHDELKRVNLAAVWANFRTFGARYVVVAAVIDSVAQRDRYADCLAGCEVRVVRLVADAETVRGRLHGRDTGAKLARHLRALDDPAGAAVEDFTVVNDRTPAQVAAEILARAGWMDPPPATG